MNLEERIAANGWTLANGMYSRSTGLASGVRDLHAEVSVEHQKWRVIQAIRGMKPRVVGAGYGASIADALAMADRLVTRILEVERTFRAPIPFAHVEVFTDVFERSHGIRPHGTGNWIFAIGCLMDDFDKLTRIPYCLYSEAKKIAHAQAAALGIGVVQVCP